MEYGILSVLPPLITIIFALLVKNVFVALLIGIFLSSIVMTGSNIFLGIDNAFYSIVATFESTSNTIILMASFVVGALIYLIERTGGIDGFVDVMVKKRGLIKSKRAAAVFTWFLGILLFTSGTLSCMVTGSVSRPLNDSLKLPHEKAAFLVHTTSTPWCVLFPLSGWLAAMAGYLVAGGVDEAQSVTVLIQSIPFNFYCIIAVVFALLAAIFPLDFGPMKAAEKRAEETGLLDDPASAPSSTEPTSAPLSNVKPRAENMLVPMAVMIGTILATLFITGGGNPTAGDGTKALLWGSMCSLTTLMVMCYAQKIFKLDELINEVMKGMGTMMPMVGVLLLGFTMGTLVKSLDTGNYLSSIFMQMLTPSLLPALTFVLAMILSFATGTSLGTMAITSVIVLPMAMSMGVSVPLVAGAMYGGSIFGDHASPISDTTIMSCGTTGCNIIDHVKTQMPYTCSFAAVSIVLYLIVGFVM